MFIERIRTDALIPYIELDEAESDLYHGSGDAIAYVNSEGRIEKLVYVGQLAEDGAQAAGQDALNHGNAWLGMCSTYTFCQPEKLDGSNAALFARIARLVEDNYDLDNWDDDDC